MSSSTISAVARRRSRGSPMRSRRTRRSLGNFYPGVRRVITSADQQAYAYAMTACEPRRHSSAEGSASTASTSRRRASRSSSRSPAHCSQRSACPHFDSPDQNLLAMLHFLRVPQGSGTAFYRHRSTGIERVSNEKSRPLADRANSEFAKTPPADRAISTTPTNITSRSACRCGTRPADHLSWQPASLGSDSAPE